jgi:hypothetical protein
MASEDYFYPGGTQIWFGTQFYIKGYLTMNNPCATPLNVNCHQDRDFDYIISPRFLPYQSIIASNSGYILYSYEKPGNRTIELPYTIDIGFNDEEIIKNFHSAESNQIRWTKNNSKILLEYPKSCGEMKVSVKIGGGRPSDNPANVMFSINDYPLGNITYTGNPKIISYSIPVRYLADYYNILDISTNTWNPRDFGSKDNRDLGIQVDWVSIQSKDP